MINENLNPRLLHPRDQIALVMSRIYRRGLTTTSGGNISIMDDNGDIWISPSAVDKGRILVTGNQLLQTFDYLEVAEFSAKSLVLCASIGNLVPISNQQVEELRHAFLKDE